MEARERSKVEEGSGGLKLWKDEKRRYKQYGGVTCYTDFPKTRLVRKDSKLNPVSFTTEETLQRQNQKGKKKKKKKKAA